MRIVSPIILPSLALLTCLTYLIKNGLFFSSFNVDEAILFMSVQTDNLRQVILNNRNGGSLDPGGFNILLYFWSGVSNQTWWLRLLPFGFLFSGIVFLALTLRLFTKNLLYLFLPFIFCFYSDNLLNHGFEIRSYAMEFCGHSLLIYFIVYLSSENKKFSKKLLFSAGLAFFLSSRYLLLSHRSHFIN